MKINNTVNPDALKAYGANGAQQAQPTQPATGKQSGSTVSIQDKVDISSRVRMFQDIKKTAIEAPAIRHDKVKGIELLDAGNKSVDKYLAVAMPKDERFNSILNRYDYNINDKI